ncbi:unnamed protein product [Microthlaspi erraticum]|uniref:Uncharacterized protein n=1 Tax=Microthlaspi erraticum TaxID=1685480 RepID=A0A6D2HYU1_9BRAS|nr:unnamed protein product [Microthlaspi erraticum]
MAVVVVELDCAPPTRVDPPDPPDLDPPDFRRSLLPDLVVLPQSLDLSSAPRFEPSFPSAKASRKCFTLSAYAEFASAGQVIVGSANRHPFSSIVSPVRLAGKPLPLLNHHASPTVMHPQSFIQNFQFLGLTCPLIFR